MQKLITATVILFYASFFFLDYCNPAKPAPAIVEQFKTGDILLSDYVCPDTLIVVDAVGLNQAMALIDQGIIEPSDSAIDSVLHMFCEVK